LIDTFRACYKVKLVAKLKLIDVGACIGCEVCEKVCEFTNSGARVNIYSTSDGILVPVTCVHCTNPICMRVCPTGAIYKDDEGVVLVREYRCIGCKLCSIACPFGAPNIEPPTGIMKKCDLCAERRRQGLAPACVETCPSGVILYGEYEEVIKKAKTKAIELLRKMKVLSLEEKTDFNV